MSVDTSPGSGVFSTGRARIAQRTLRTDNWRRAPIITMILLTALGALRAGPDADPAELLRASSTTTCRRSPRRASRPPACPRPGTSAPGSGDFPPLVPFAILALPFLLGFRLTCYYYRKAYYRSFWLLPAGLRGRRRRTRKYTGETRFPLIVQNVHRYFFYAAVMISLVNTYDAIRAFQRQGRRLRHRPRAP